MPDAHLGYALPIGGVVALDNAVSPHFVGFDIACRMTATILDTTPKELIKHQKYLSKSLQEVTSFGLGAGFKGKDVREHEVMEDDMWRAIPKLKELKPLAQEQLGSSGGGNHFADLMIGEITEDTDWLKLNKGDEFVALVTHSGSRGTGHKVATYYSRLAKDWAKYNVKGIPKGYEWLPLNTPQGLEYWMAMQLMGDYAQANHHLMHDYFLETVYGVNVQRIENHHNFAWLEEGEIIHRKGATPAGVGDVGIIPGSMGTNSYIVEGLGNKASLNSSAHGAGRYVSRTKAKKLHDEDAHRRHVRHHEIQTIGVEADESYQAYKDIERVMELQAGTLVKPVAKMFPRVVIMGGRSDDGD
jgi:tRNA-splicing ligase RtcB